MTWLNRPRLGYVTLDFEKKNPSFSVFIIGRPPVSPRATPATARDRTEQHFQPIRDMETSRGSATQILIGQIERKEEKLKSGRAHSRATNTIVLEWVAEDL